MHDSYDCIVIGGGPAGSTAAALVAQASHVLMTLAVLYVAGDVARARRYRALRAGIALGLAVLVPYTLAQHLYFEAHPGLLDELFAGSFEVPGE